MKPTAPTRPAWHPDAGGDRGDRRGPPRRSVLASSACMAATAMPLSVRVFWPGAESVTVIDRATGEHGRRTREARIPPASSPGRLPGRNTPFVYRLRFTAGGATWEAEDPYRFPPILGSLDVYLMAEGSHRRIFERLGAHPTTIEGVDGVAFAVWAPNARARQRRRRLQPMGRPPPPDAQAHRGRHAGRSSFPASAAATRYKFELLPTGGGPPLAEGRPGRLRSTRSRRRPPRSSPACRSHEWGDGGMDGSAPRATGAVTRRSPSTRCISAPGGARTATAFLTYDELADELDPLREGHGLHPHRVPAGLRASVLRLVGLSADRALRADQPLRPAGSLRPLRRPLPSGRASASSSTGCRRISRPTRTASPASTAPRSTSTRTRASASIRTGTR